MNVNGDSNDRTGRDGTGRFLPGVSGNPQGKAPGCRNRASLVVESLLDGQAEALAEKVIEMALAGNTPALRLCLDRLQPAQKERQMVLQLPPPATAEELLEGFARVAEALCAGDLTPSEINSVAALLESARRALETTELARRICELENRVEASPHGTESQS